MEVAYELPQAATRTATATTAPSRYANRPGRPLRIGEAGIQSPYAARRHGPGRTARCLSCSPGMFLRGLQGSTAGWFPLRTSQIRVGDSVETDGGETHVRGRSEAPGHASIRDPGGGKAYSKASDEAYSRPRSRGACRSWPQVRRAAERFVGLGLRAPLYSGSGKSEGSALTCENTRAAVAMAIRMAISIVV